MFEVYTYDVRFLSLCRFVGWTDAPAKTHNSQNLLFCMDNKYYWMPESKEDSKPDENLRLEEWNGTMADFFGA